jgi:hypothetical protein
MAFVKLVLEKYIIFKMFNQDFPKMLFSFRFRYMMLNYLWIMMMGANQVQVQVKQSGSRLVAMPALRAQRLTSSNLALSFSI